MMELVLFIQQLLILNMVIFPAKVKVILAGIHMVVEKKLPIISPGLLLMLMLLMLPLLSL